MSEPDIPRIEFPCDYPVKVLGRSSDEFEALILDVFERHAPGFDQRAVAVRASARGTFTAITVIITATGVEQLQALHQELMATGHVQMVI